MSLTQEAPLPKCEIPTDFNDVRAASIYELASLMDVCAEAHADNGVFTNSPKKVETILRRFLPEGGVGVIGAPNAIEAICIVGDSVHWYSDYIYLAEYLIYICEGYRNRNHLPKLIEWMRDRADERKQVLIYGVASIKRTDAKSRLFRRYAKPFGEGFIYFPGNK